MLFPFIALSRRWMSPLFKRVPSVAGLWSSRTITLLQSLSMITGLWSGSLIGFGLAFWFFIKIHNRPPTEKDTIIQDRENLALHEVKEIHVQVLNAVEALSSKATALLSNSGMILALFGVLQIALLEPGQPGWYKIGLALIVILYIAVVILLLIVLAPKDYRLTFVADWDGVDNAIRLHSLEQATTQLLSNYLARIQHNTAIHHRNIVCYQYATRLFGSIVTLLVVLSLFAQR